jgi:hypothetical protein
MTSLPADPITHLVLNLCARTEDITRDRIAPNAPWRLRLRGKRITDPRTLSNLEIALTALEAAGLIQWFSNRGAQLEQYPLDTTTGRTTLLNWDASALAGGEL